MKFLAIALLFAVVALVASDDSGSGEGHDVQTQRPSRPLAGDRPNRPNRRPNVSQLFAAFAANGFRPSRRPNRRTTTAATSTTEEMAVETFPAGKQMSTDVPSPPRKPFTGRPERPMRPKPDGAAKPRPEGKPDRPQRRPSTTTVATSTTETLPAGKQMSTEVPPPPMKPFTGRPERPMRPRPAGKPEKPNRRPSDETKTALPLGKQLAEEEPVQGEEKPRPNNRPAFAGPFPALMGQRPGPFGGPRPMADGQRPQIPPFMAGPNGPRPMADGQRPQIPPFMAGPNGQRPQIPPFMAGPNGPKPVGQMGGQRPLGGGFAGMGGRPRPRPTEMPVEPTSEQ